MAAVNLASPRKFFNELALPRRQVRSCSKLLARYIHTRARQALEATRPGVVNARTIGFRPWNPRSSLVPHGAYYSPSSTSSLT
jgi:hypothetical protein